MGLKGKRKWGIVWESNHFFAAGCCCRGQEIIFVEDPFFGRMTNIVDVM